MMSQMTVLLMAIVIMSGFIGGCQSPVTDDQNSNGDGSAVATAERGPVTMTVRVAKAEITLAERVRVDVEVLAEEGVEVAMPEFGKEFEAFAIRDYGSESAKETPDGRRRWGQWYELDLFVSGDYAIPSMTARFTDRRKGEDAIVESSLSTEPIEITVASLAEGEFDPTQFRDVKGPVELPVSRTWAWTGWVAGGLFIAGMAVPLGTWLVRRAKRPAATVVIAAHEWAFDELQRLIDDRLIEDGLIHEFYFRLSMIVRQYIEMRFSLMAPERTTEEFLEEVQGSDALGLEHRGMLRGFLQACDLVKFALYEPGSEEIERAFNAARDFVDQSADRTGLGNTRAAA